jgi:hypothetical protein
MTTTTVTMFRGQFKAKGSRRWSTYCERGSSSAVWDELLSAPELKSHDLRVLRIEVEPTIEVPRAE